MFAIAKVGERLISGPLRRSERPVVEIMEGLISKFHAVASGAIIPVRERLIAEPIGRPTESTAPVK